MKTIRPALYIALESVRHFAPKREIPTPYCSIDRSRENARGGQHVRTRISSLMTEISHWNCWARSA